MPTIDPNGRSPRALSGDTGGRWIVGIIVVVLIGLGVSWWAGTGSAGPMTANTAARMRPTTTGAAPSSHPPDTSSRATASVGK